MNLELVLTGGHKLTINDVTLDTARALAHELIESTRAGGYTGPVSVTPPEATPVSAAPIPDAPTFRQAAAEYMERSQTRKRTRDECQRIIDKELNPIIGDKPVRDVTKRDIRVLLDKIVSRPAPAMANQVLVSVRSIFTWAVSMEILARNPTDNIRKPAKDVARDRVLSDDELKRVILACEELDTPMSRAILLMAYLAQRRTEITAMEWADIDWENAIYTVPAARSKNSHSHRVPLPEQAINILNRQRAVVPENCRFVFPNPVDAGKSCHPPQREKDKIFRNAGVTGATLHDLRRSAATKMVGLGIPVEVVSRVLNHSGGGNPTTAIYNRHSYDDQKRDALERYARRLVVLTSDSPQSSGPDGRLGSFRIVASCSFYTEWRGG